MAAKGEKFLCALVLILIFGSPSLGQTPNDTTSSTAATAATTTATTTTTKRPTDAPASTLPPNTDLAVCTCDLTANGCDVNCCCDRTDCSDDDIKTFTTCIDSYTPPDSQSCIKRNILFKDNSPYEKNETDPSLFCVIKDNYAERNYYMLPEAVDTVEKFEEYEARYGGNSYKPTDRKEEFPTTFYKSGDPIYSIYSTLTLGKLSLPQALISKDCSDANPATFLVDRSNECSRSLSEIRQECGANPALDARSFYKDFKLIKTFNFSVTTRDPESISGGDGEGDTTATTAVPTEATTAAPSRRKRAAGEPTLPMSREELGDLYNSSHVLPIRLVYSHICQTPEGVNLTCNFTGDVPQPLLYIDVTTNITYCKYAVIAVDYTIEQNGTHGLTDAEVKFTFKDLIDSNSPLLQRFSLKYTKLGEGETFERSGNPGYQVGQQLLAGRLTIITLPDETERSAINIDSNRNNWLTIVKSSVTGDCLSEVNLRQPVTFGESLRSGCRLTVTYSNMSTGAVCSLLQEAANNALLGPNPVTHVAMFGNTVPETTGDWVPIVPSPLTEQPDNAAGSAGVCSGLSLGLHIEVMYANVGALGNPQPKVIGVRYDWEEPQTIQFECSGPFCQTGTDENLTQDFEVVSSVTFIDASDSPTAVDAEHPQFTAKLPEDFFYPFT